MKASVSVYNAIYYDDVETLKAVNNPNKIFSLKALKFAGHCGSLECLKYILIYFTRPDYIIDVIVAATKGDSVNILQYVLEQNPCEDFVLTMMYATTLNCELTLRWLAEKGKYSKEYLDEQLSERFESECYEDDMEEYNKIKILRPKKAVELWHDYNGEYDSLIQWLPREVMEDVEKMVVQDVISNMKI